MARNAAAGRAALIAAAGRGAGIHLTNETIVHAVMLAEQLLTTGGGWQDQVGGVYPGAKIARSAARLPLKVDCEPVQLPEGFADVLGKHIVLIYTGRARLARNLLQNVIRRWYARLPEIVSTARDLTDNAVHAAEALCAGDLARVGACLSAYWKHKKTMADGCEPDFVREMIAGFADLIHGASLAGAGGGGFLVLVTKAADAIPLLRERLAGMEMSVPGHSFHSVTVDTKGLDVRVEREAGD